MYLFGLVACYHHEAISDLQQMARELNMTEDDIRAAYRYWERKGLVQRVADNPPQYRYQNIYQVMMTGAQAQIDPAYEQFAEAIYGVFDNDRRLHGKDVSQCYEWVEQMRLPPDVVIAMMRHMVQKHGKNLVMNLGYSHQVIVTENDDIKLEVPQPNTIVVSGIDKQKVGQFAAEVREKRPPEPYKGKGIHYVDERIIRKEGKAGKGKK